MIPYTCPCCEVSHPPHRDGCTLHDDCPREADLFDEVASLRAEVGRLREERRWIPVGERLPETAQRVWAFVPAVYGAQEARWVDGHWRDHFGRVGPVTHWQPLPAPPKGGERKE